MSTFSGMLCGIIGRHDLGRSSAPALIGLALPLLTLFWIEAGIIGGRLGLLSIVIFSWQLTFRRLRKQGFGFEGLVSVILLALLTPVEAPYWQLLLGASFGLVLGELVFGGRGRNFVHPVIAALAFLMFSFTGEPYRTGPQIPLWTLAPAAIFLLLSGQAAWRVLVPATTVIILVAWGSGSQAALLANGAVALALLFLAADPVASAATNAGRIVYGASVGLLAALFSLAGEAFGSIVFAILLASIFAPLIDQCAIMIHIRTGKRRHDRL